MKRRFRVVKTFLTNYRYFWDKFLRQNSSKGQRRIHDIRKEAAEKFDIIPNIPLPHQQPSKSWRISENICHIIIGHCKKKTSWNINLEIRAKQALTVPASYMLMAASTSLTGCAQEAKSIGIILDLVQNCTAMQSSMQCVAHTLPVCKMALHWRWW